MYHEKGRQLCFVPNKYLLPGQVYDLHKAIAKYAMLGIYINGKISPENKTNIWMGLHADTKFLPYK